MTDVGFETVLRDALQTAPTPPLGFIDPGAVITRGRRRRRMRVAAIAAGCVSSLVVAMGLTGGLPSRQVAVQPASGGATSEERQHQAWLTWADCLRDQGIPGVEVLGPPDDSNAITYTDIHGNPLPSDFRNQNGEWGSATELCAAEVPALIPELEAQWGDLTSRPGG